MCLGIRHPIFTAPLIYLPMLLIALDRLITDRKVLMYSLFVGISMFTNYYFLYINTVAMGVYALIRFAQDIYFAEFDGPQMRTYYIEVMGE